MEHVRWTPGIGDPTFVGWLTVFAYFACAWLCLKALRSEKSGPPRPTIDSIRALLRVLRKHWPKPPVPAQRAALWLALALILAALGLNKQLDLQSLLTDVGRLLAFQGGWYSQRRLVQTAFILTLAGGGGLTLVFLWRLTRRSMRDLRLSLGGLALLVCFVITRATSFHHVDQLIGMSLMGLRFNAIFELSGIGVIAAGAYRQIRSRADRNDPAR